MKLANTVNMIDEWIKKARAARRRGSRLMMIPPNTVTNFLLDLEESNATLTKLHERLGETNFSNLLK